MSTSWLWPALGWVLAMAGAALLFWALLWDRARGRRRCPKCWYSMAGVPGLKCPECGREARRESALLRTRRRWRWAAPGIALSLVGTQVAEQPSRAGEGWWSWVPSTLLIGIPAAIELDTHRSLAQLIDNRTPAMWSWQAGLLYRTDRGFPDLDVNALVTA